MEAEQEYPEYSRKSPRPSDNKIWDFFDPDPKKEDFFIEILGLCFSPLNIYFFLYSHKFYY